MNIIFAIAAVIFSALTAFTFFKAGSMKAKASEETLLGAGMGWVKGRMGFTRLVAWLESLGAIGILAGPFGAWVTNFEWSKWTGVAAGAGLTLTMVVAYLTAHREDAFVSLSDFTDQAPFPFLMAALATLAFGAGKFSVDRLLQPWFDRITGNNRLSS